MSNPYQPPTSPDPSREPYPGAGQDAPYGFGGVQSYGRPHGPTGDHPQGTLILVLGLVGIAFPIAAPFAWALGGRALREIRASGSQPANRQFIAIGRILGIVMTLLMVLGVVLGVILVVLTAAVASGIQ